MAHIHLEDGAFTLQWISVWWVLAIILIGLCLYWMRKTKETDSKTITIAAMCTAASFAIFQVNVPLFGGVHMNLTPLIGILGGPAVGGIIVFIVNILSASIGHGGWGMIGANVLVNMTEVSAAFGTYKWIGKTKMSTFARAGTATLIGLFLGNITMIAVILISGVQGVTQSRIDMLYGLSLLAGVNMGVAVIEAIITGYTVSYIERIRPDMLLGVDAVD
ncbi:MAG: energy-coupling factor ABC transporter permease [Methanotrichaceae archaeon]